MEEKNNLLELACDVAPLVKYLRERGVLNVDFADDPTLGIQIWSKAFIKMFDSYEVETYPAEDDYIGRRAVAVYHGQRFFALLESEGEE